MGPDGQRKVTSAPHPWNWPGLQGGGSVSISHIIRKLGAETFKSLPRIHRARSQDKVRIHTWCCVDSPFPREHSASNRTPATQRGSPDPSSRGWPGRPHHCLPTPTPWVLGRLTLPHRLLHAQKILSMGGMRQKWRRLVRDMVWDLMRLIFLLNKYILLIGLLRQYNILLDFQHDANKLCE